MGVVVLGAHGRLGRLLRPVFPVAATWLGRGDADITDGSALRRVLDAADAVLCLAGVTNARFGPMEGNSDLALRTLDAAQVVGAGRVFLFSSAAVYGRVSGMLGEDGPTAPLSPYGVAKLEMERIATAHTHPSTVLRLGNVAGADAILGGWKPGFALDTLPDGSTPLRSYIGPATLARLLSDLCAAPDLPPLLNVAAPGAVAMGALLDAADLPWLAQPANGDTIAKVVLDTTRLQRIATFAPHDGTPEGIVADWQRVKGTR